MRLLRRLPLILVALVCIAVLVASTQPGVLSDVAFDAAFLSIAVLLIAIPVAAIGGLVLLVLSARGRITIGWPWPVSRRGLAGGTVLRVLIILLVFWGVPRRLVFATVRKEFDELAASALRNPPDRSTAFDRRVGPYWVDRCAVDERGGLYFRTHTGPVGISPDTLSGGFCFEPNRKGTPFGAAGYELQALGGGWYSFSASNDWY